MTHEVQDVPGPESTSGGSRTSRHGPIAQLLIAWSPLSVVLVGYAVAGWITAPLEAGEDTNLLGLPLHVTGPAELDRALFGAIPSVWLQQQLTDGSAQWYDGFVALVYVTHFVGIPLVTGWVWFRLRSRFGPWLLALLTLTTAGYVGYVLYPAAPPWDASRQGVIGTVHRISTLGWNSLHLHPLGQLTAFGQQQSNTVAAMPSLHAGVALLIALFLWPTVRRTGRLLLLGYAAAMAFVLVYTGEHYVVDVLAGWALAGLAMAVAVVGPRLTSRTSTYVDPPAASHRSGTSRSS